MHTFERVLSGREIRAHWGAIFDEVLAIGGIVVVERNGRRAAVLLGQTFYAELVRQAQLGAAHEARQAQSQRGPAGGGT